MDDNIDISVSGLFEKDDRKIAYVSFSSGDKTAEGTIPECGITRNNGFSDSEKEQLEEYMRANVIELRKMASGINVMDAFMEKKK